jgi:hypothetical protein
LTYNTLVTGYLIYLGIGGEWSGKLLWPAALVHAVLTILLVYAWFKEREPEGKHVDQGGGFALYAKINPDDALP